MAEPRPRKPARNREMTAEDRRRVLTVDDGLHDQSLVVVAPERDPDAVPDASSDRALQHLDGKAEPRPDREWETLNSVQRARAWEGGRDERGKTVQGEREALTKALRRAREAAPLPDRLGLVQRELLKIQSPRAQQARLTDARSGADVDHTGPTGGRHGDVAHADPREIATRLRLIALQVEALEEILDEHHGRARRSYALMSQEEKDRLLTGEKLRDLSPEEIHALHPELGAARTIRMVRALADQDKFGNPQRTKAAAA